MAGVAGRSGGRNAKTVSEHRIAGTFQNVRHGDFSNPDPPRGTPDPPKALTGEAQAEWDRMVTRLTSSGTLSVVDDGALYQYCQLFSETEAIAVVQAETGAAIDVLEQSLGDFKGPELIAAFQELTKLRQLEARYTTQIRQGRMGLRVYLIEFGLTPASRSRVKIPEGRRESKLSRFIA